MAQNGTAAGPSKLLNGKKKSAFQNEIHGGGKRYRCCDTGKLAVSQPNIPLSSDRNITLLTC